MKMEKREKNQIGIEMHFTRMCACSSVQFNRKQHIAREYCTMVE